MESKLSVLIVEDEAIVALGLEDTLQQEGYKVAGVADNGKEALDIVNRESVDLDLLDIHIKGDWDGIERSEEHTSELQSLMRISYAVCCLKKNNNQTINASIYTDIKQ